MPLFPPVPSLLGLWLGGRPGRGRRGGLGMGRYLDVGIDCRLRTGVAYGGVCGLSVASFPSDPTLRPRPRACGQHSALGTLQVSRAEFSTGVRQFGVHVSRTELDALFDEWDTNRRHAHMLLVLPMLVYLWL